MSIFLTQLSGESLDQFQRLPELISPRLPQQLVDDHFRRGNRNASIAHTLESNLPIVRRPRGDSITDDMHRVVMKRMQCCLRHADMRLDAGDDEGIPVQLAYPLDKSTGFEAVKFQLSDGFDILQFLTDLWDRLPEILLFRKDDRQADKAGELDELKDILNYPLPFCDDRQETLLHVNDHHDGIIPPEHGVPE